MAALSTSARCPSSAPILADEAVAVFDAERFGERIADKREAVLFRL
jgi:hypothetical protein